MEREFPAFDPSQAVNELGAVGGKATYPNLKSLGPAYQRFDAKMRSPEFLAEIGRLTGIANLLYDPDYVGGGAHLNMTGQELDMHVDFNFHPRTRWHRRLNLILFLNRRWDESWGGNLELHLDPRLAREENEVVRVVPAFNRCVIFETSERSWHGFRRIEVPEESARLGRRSIAATRKSNISTAAHSNCRVPSSPPRSASDAP